MSETELEVIFCGWFEGFWKIHVIVLKIKHVIVWDASIRRLSLTHQPIKLHEIILFSIWRINIFKPLLGLPLIKKYHIVYDFSFIHVLLYWVHSAWLHQKKFICDWDHNTEPFTWLFCSKAFDETAFYMIHKDMILDSCFNDIFG